MSETLRSRSVRTTSPLLAVVLFAGLLAGSGSLRAQEAGPHNGNQAGAVATATGASGESDAPLRERLAWMLGGYHFSPDREALDELGTPEAVAEALRGLADDSSMRPSLRMRAVDALAEYDEPEVRDFLEGLLEAPSDQLSDRRQRVAGLLRHRAMTSLARVLGDRRSVEKLAPFLEAEDLQLRLTAVRALGDHAGEAGRLRLETFAGDVRDPSLKRALRRVLPESKALPESR